MPTPPTFTKVNPADQPIIYIALTSHMLPLCTLDEYAETRIAQRISMITGVAQVQVLGRRNTPCTCRWTRTRWPRTRSASTKWRPRSKLERQSAHRLDHRTAARLHPAGQRPVDARR